MLKNLWTRSDPRIMASPKQAATWEAEVTFLDTDSAPFKDLRGLAIAPNGTYALVVNNNYHNIARFDLLTREVTFITDTNMRYPQDVAIALDGSYALVAPADISKDAEVRATAEGILEMNGGIDGMVNAAGVRLDDGPLLEAPVEVLNRSWAVNVRGSYLVARAAVGILAGSGRIGQVVCAGAGAFGVTQAARAACPAAATSFRTPSSPPSKSSQSWRQEGTTA